MSFDPTLSETRFGCGLSPDIAPPGSVNEMLEGVAGPDLIATRYGIEDFDAFRSRLLDARRLRREFRNAKGTDKEQAARQARRALAQQTRKAALGWMRQSMLRRARTPAGFRERLVFFWADHFSARGKASLMKYATAPYIETALRPHLSGRFEDLLIAAVTHPLMLNYLDQDRSIGPNSQLAKRKPTGLGLNENLAREILELHSLGVDAGYTQKDVRQLAEALTGLSWRGKDEQQFFPNRAEPGAEVVLGKWYGAQAGSLDDIHNILRDLARHPATTAHIARKLAVHFVSDRPAPALVAHIEAAFLETRGDLLAVYRAMLEHPDAWTPEGANIKQPVAYVGSALRALGVQESDVKAWNTRHTMRHLGAPMHVMGQPWEKPAGPDGWPEEDAQWGTPQGLAARLQWALQVPELLGREAPDPRAFVQVALGSAAPERVRFAAEAAENRREGIALVLMSPAFQRH